MNNRIRTRKGFTLIELIVVIAILGVLAAILIPAMIGYVTDSKVASMNSTAAEMKKQIDYFLTEADVSGYGMKKGSVAYAEPHISVINGQWVMLINETPLSNIFKETTVSWAAVGSGQRDEPIVGKNASELLAIALANHFPEIKNAYIGFRIEEGKCVALYFTSDSNSPVVIQNFNTGGWDSATYIWDTQRAGVNSSGLIIGTAPMLPLG